MSGMITVLALLAGLLATSLASPPLEPSSTEGSWTRPWTPVTISKEPRNAEDFENSSEFGSEEFMEDYDSGEADQYSAEESSEAESYEISEEDSDDSTEEESYEFSEEDLEDISEEESEEFSEEGSNEISDEEESEEFSEEGSNEISDE